MAKRTVAAKDMKHGQQVLWDGTWVEVVRTEAHPTDPSRFRFYHRSLDPIYRHLVAWWWCQPTDRFETRGRAR